MKIFVRFKCYHLQYKLGSLTIVLHQQTRQGKKGKCNQATIAQTMNQDPLYLVLPMASCGSTSFSTPSFFHLQSGSNTSFCETYFTHLQSRKTP